MSRPPRIWLDDGVYHLTARGNNRQAIFLDSSDYQQYLLMLHQSTERFPYRLIAYALMTNHIHLVVQSTPQGSVSEAMRFLGGCYSRYFNERHHRVGHLYQGRFYSNLVETDSYLLEVTRYVHLNAYRAGLVLHPLDYTWSSYPIYVGRTPDLLRLIDPSRILAFFGPSRQEQSFRYQQFVDELAREEWKMTEWIRELRRHKLIPPARWRMPEVTVTSGKK